MINVTHINQSYFYSFLFLKYVAYISDEYHNNNQKKYLVKYLYINWGKNRINLQT